MRVLILGGTTEALQLAAELAARGIDVVTSLAGVVSRPTHPAGELRVGRFAGADDLENYLRADGIERVVDATHPFAAAVTWHAAQACERTRTPFVVLHRPAWTPGPDDQWIPAADVAAAASTVRASMAGTVLLTIGRQDLAHFADDTAHHFVVRSVEIPVGPLPPRRTLLLDRGPFELKDELALLTKHEVQLMVTKNSGGSMTAAKLAAAARLGVPVLVIDRPATPLVTCFEDTHAVVRWLHEVHPSGPPRR